MANVIYIPPQEGGGGDTIAAGAGISITGTTVKTISLTTTTVTPGSYTSTNLTVDAYGRITAASNGSSGSGTQGGTTSSPFIPYASSANTLSDSGMQWDSGTSLMSLAGNLVLTGGSRKVGNLSNILQEFWSTYWIASNNDYLINVPGAYLAYIVNGEFLCSFRPQTGFQPETAGRKLGNNSSAATRWGAFFLAEDNTTTTPGTSGTAAAGSISGQVVLSAGNTTYTLTCNGITTSHKVFANTSAGDIVAVRAVPTANTITFTISAAAGANTTIQWVAISG